MKYLFIPMIRIYLALAIVLVKIIIITTKTLYLLFWCIKLPKKTNDTILFFKTFLLSDDIEDSYKYENRKTRYFYKNIIHYILKRKTEYEKDPYNPIFKIYH